MTRPTERHWIQVEITGDKAHTKAMQIDLYMVERVCLARKGDSDEIENVQIQYPGLPPGMSMELKGASAQWFYPIWCGFATIRETQAKAKAGEIYIPSGADVNGVLAGPRH